MPGAEAGDRQPATGRVERDPDQPVAAVAALLAGVAFVDDSAEDDPATLPAAVEDVVTDAVAVSGAGARGESGRALGGAANRQPQARRRRHRQQRDRAEPEHKREPSATEAGRQALSRHSSR